MAKLEQDPENLGVDTGRRLHPFISYLSCAMAKKRNFGNGYLNLHIGRHLVFSITETN